MILEDGVTIVVDRHTYIGSIPDFKVDAHEGLKKVIEDANARQLMLKTESEIEDALGDHEFDNVIDE